jgi:hypothetical protein
VFTLNLKWFTIMHMKVIKYRVPLAIIILSLMFGYVVYAEDNAATASQPPVACSMIAKACPDGSFVSRTGPNCEFAKCPGVKDNTAGEKVKSKLQDIKNRLESRSEGRQARMQVLIDTMKAKRAELKANFEANKEQFKLKLDAAKVKFRDSLSKIKDENKKLSAEKIVNLINEINAKTTTNFSDKVDRIENVLLGIESRIDKAESRGLDVTEVNTEVTKAKDAIASARDAISTEASKVYATDTTVSDEASLKAEMKTLRDTFKTDIKTVQEKVKGARDAVKTVAVTLAKIPKIDDDTTAVEDNNTNN